MSVVLIWSHSNISVNICFTQVITTWRRIARHSPAVPWQILALSWQWMGTRPQMLDKRPASSPSSKTIPGGPYNYQKGQEWRRWLLPLGIKQVSCYHDDVIKWKHFARHWPFVRGIHRWRGALLFSSICAWTNGCANTRDNSGLRRHLSHYDVTVMSIDDVACDCSIASAAVLEKPQYCAGRSVTTMNTPVNWNSIYLFMT